MRPIRLEVQGLTAYKQKTEVDFSGLDLFAITGPTGAGKSSLVDAITYALFGQVPRVGRGVRELISQGSDKLQVKLEFAVNSDRYRIFRESSRKTAKAPQLERFDPEVNDWRDEEVDRVKDTNEFIERLLRMDYEAFIRSVLLPQGEFQEFLAGDRDQRRKVLDGLLQLGVYARMGQIANAMAARNNDRAAEITRRLETELADATPEALKRAKADLKTLQTQAGELKAAREAIEEACRAADGLTVAREKEQRARDAIVAAQKVLDGANKLLDSSERTLKALDDQIAAVRAEIAAAQYDGDLHIRLTKALGIIQQCERVDANIKNHADELARAKSEVDRLTKAEKDAEQEQKAAEKAAADAHDRWEKARTANAALVVQRSLRPGEPCLVCGQTVHELPAEGAVHELDSLKKAESDARAAEQKAREASGEIRQGLAVANQRIEGLQQQIAGLESESRQHIADLRELGEEGAERADVEARIKALQEAKLRIESLSAQERKAAEDREGEAKAIAEAKRETVEKAAEIKGHERDAAEASAQAAELVATLREAATKNGWDDAVQAIESGDPAAILRRRLTDVQTEDIAVNQRIGSQTKQIEVIASNIEKAKELQTEERALKEEGRLARDLASLLRADAFPTFIRESALKTLARVGSERLLEISGGRYDFVVEGQDFLVEDRWNGGEKRSVKTLSGGETFLASLALALALAEQLPGLAGDGVSGRLESLFIDEGFSHLDNETLNIVAEALEVLGEDRSRLIGVITHVPALAERMPSRITVHKTQQGSSVTVD